MHTFSFNARLCLVILATGMVVSLGCDPVRTIRHHVKMTVVDDRGSPVPDVKVRMKESWKSWQSWEPVGVAKSDENYWHQRWQNVPWYEGVANVKGEAAIGVEVTALDHTRGSQPSAERDIVSNREFIVKLHGQNIHDEMLVVVKPGTVAMGKRYTIKIEEIEKPRYVP